MTCPRCTGLMLRDHRDLAWPWWHCLICGERVDRRVRANRLDQVLCRPALPWRSPARLRAEALFGRPPAATPPDQVIGLPPDRPS